MRRSRTGARWTTVLPLLMAVLAACAKEEEPEPEPVRISDRARVLDEAARQRLASFDPVGGTLVFSTTTPQLAALEPGDILVSEPSAAAPYGLLRKVSSTSPLGQGLVVETTQGSLKEVILEGNLVAEGTVTPADLTAFEPAPGVGVVRSGLSAAVPFSVVVVDRDGNPSTTGDQLRVNGDAGFDMGFKVEMGWKAGYDPPFDVDISTKFIAILYLTQHAQLGVVATGPIFPSFYKEVAIGTYSFTPITFWIGPIPVVLVPRVAVSITAGGTINTALSFGVDETIGFQAGVSKPFGEGFSPVFDFTPSASGWGPSLTPGYGDLSFGVGVAAKARGSLRLYGIVGPYVDVSARGHLNGGVGQSPPWRIRGSVGGELGVEIDLYFWDYDWSEPIFDQTWDIVQATGNTPPVITSVSPKPGAKVQLGQPIDLHAIAGDVEDGYFCCTRSWTSSADGALGTEGPFGMKHTFTTPGIRNLTISATDAHGATVTASTAIEVVNTPPVVTLIQPQPGSTEYVGGPLFIGGWAIDGNQPCSSLALSWSSSNPADVMPPASCTGKAQITFGTAGTRTLSLKATDAQGASDTKSVAVSVLAPPPNYPPSIYVDSPTSGASFTNYDHLVLTATVYDKDDSTLSYAWFNTTWGNQQITPAGSVFGANNPGGSNIANTVPSTSALLCPGTNTIELRVGGGANDPQYKSVFVYDLSCTIVPH